MQLTSPIAVLLGARLLNAAQKLAAVCPTLGASSWGSSHHWLPSTPTAGERGHHLPTAGKEGAKPPCDAEGSLLPHPQGSREDLPGTASPARREAREKQATYHPKPLLIACVLLTACSSCRRERTISVHFIFLFFLI